MHPDNPPVPAEDPEAEDRKAGFVEGAGDAVEGIADVGSVVDGVGDLASAASDSGGCAPSCDGCDMPSCGCDLLLFLRLSTVLLAVVAVLPAVTAVLPAGGADRLVCGLIRGYQRWLTRFTPRCPGTPSCSAYALSAVRELGARRGLAAAAHRIADCRRP